MKCKECGQEVKEEHWELWIGWTEKWEKRTEKHIGKPSGELKKTGHSEGEEWKYYVVKNCDQYLFWRKKK